MKTTILAAAIAFCGLAVPVQAMTIAPLSAAGPNVTLVAEGCGPGFHRGVYGACRPNRGAVVVAPAPGVVVAPAPGVVVAPVPGVVVAAPAPGVVVAPGYHWYHGRRCWWRGGVRVCN